MNQGSEHTTQELIITRTIQAPRELVFRAWTEPEHLKHWWGPAGADMQVIRMDLRPGGVFHYSQRLEGGPEMYGVFVYREVTPPSHLVYVNSFADATGNIIRNPWSADWPLEILNTLSFEAQGGQTLLTMRGAPRNASEAERRAFEGAQPMVQQGFTGTLNQLDTYLARL
jgi:uncharacterized protein YndB with AHSA1/START domain